MPSSGQDAAVITAGGRSLGFLPAQTQRQALATGRIFGIVIHVVVVLVVTAGILVKSGPLALVALWAGSILRGTLVTVGISSSQVVGGALGSLSSLAAAAREIARGEQVQIPRTDRSDEFGELARALQSWQTASLEREIMIQRAPVGICHLDAERRVVAANPAFAGMLGLPSEQIQRRFFRSFIHPADLDPRGTPLAGLIAGTEDRVAVEHRMVRADQSLLWCSAVHAALRRGDGPPEGFVVIVEDISERRQQLELAAKIQRELLPQTTPVLEGYQLAGVCRPAQDVAGDFYDWTLSEDGDHLDLTVADVMGKSLGSGLVMATLRAVLRSAPPELGPAARVRLAAEFLPRGVEDDGLFVTLVQGRLDLATGVLHYVDAGHGYAEVRRAGGELVRLAERSQPVGVWPRQRFAEGTVRLEPGDALIVYSDGLVETEQRAGGLSDYAEDLDQAADAQDLVARLVRRLPRWLQDDVTLLTLRRAPLPELARSSLSLSAGPGSGPPP
jgi:PAS domain S-box-containing protein